MSEIVKQYRYPGMRPFMEDDRFLFFGRDQDIECLYRLIIVEKLIVLFGKSGLGKSSLLNAGVVPLLKEQENYLTISVRFGIDSNRKVEPHVIFLNRLGQFTNSNSIIWDKLIPDGNNRWKNAENDESFWFWCKCLQIENPDKPVLFILDQFEELFYANSIETNRFAFLLSSLLHGQTPQSVKDFIIEKIKTDKNLLSKEEINLLFEPLNIKIIISVRSDKLSLLNRLKTHIPQILQKTYELQPLDIYGATVALLKPSIAEGNFISPKFEYEKQAKDKIISYLSSDHENLIEAFQLQLICQFCENLIINPDSYCKTNKLRIITIEDLGDLSTIFERYYENKLNEIPESKQRFAVRCLIEENLIIESSRVPIPDKVIAAQHHINDDVLQVLLMSRLLRCEPNTTEGFSYEISHDTLIEPILKSKNERKFQEKIIEEQNRISQENAEKYNALKERQKKIIQKIVFPSFLILFVLVTYIITLSIKNRTINRHVDRINYQLSQLKQKTDSINLYRWRDDSILIVNENIKRFVNEGDRFYNQGKYNEAVQNYDSALLRKFDEKILAKKEDAKKQIKILEEKKKKEFERLISKGDFLRSEGFEYFNQALSNYNNAQNLFNSNADINNKIMELRKIIENQYFRFMEDGRIFKEAEGYKDAADMAKKALLLKPKDKAALDLMKECENKK